LNDKRRKNLTVANSLLTQALSIIDDALSEEQNGLDNLDANFEESSQYKTMETAIDALTDAVLSIGEAQESLQVAVS
jgi:hypothetical protein